MDVRADWDDASSVIYDPEHPMLKEGRPHDILFIHGGFVPSAIPFSLQQFGKEVHTELSSLPLTHPISHSCNPPAHLLVHSGSRVGERLAVVGCGERRRWL